MGHCQIDSGFVPGDAPAGRPALARAALVAV